MSANDGGPAFPVQYCRKAGCIREASHRQGHQWLCPVHYRFGQMRSKAKQCGKTVPTVAELDAIVAKNGLRCADCNVAMNWLARDGQTHVATLQHYRDGSYSLVCRCCNTRHAFMEGDSYRDIPKDHKFCPRCTKVKPITEFATDNSRSGPMKVKSWCLACSDAAHTEWRKGNRDGYNAAQRSYRAKRKAEGRPVRGGR